MGSESDYRHYYFEQWLDTATRGLCADAKARVAEEVTAHYDDSVANLLEEGLCEEEASAKALRALGSPRQERRRLRREHLTRREAASLSAYAKKREERIRERGDKNANDNSLFSLYLGILAILLGVVFLAAAFYAEEGPRTYVSASFFFLWGLFPVGQYGMDHWVRRRRYPDGRVPEWRTAQLRGIETLFQGWSVMCLYGITVPVSTSSHLWFFEFCYGVLAISSLVAALIQLRFARKLQRLGYNAPPSAEA